MPAMYVIKPRTMLTQTTSHFTTPTTQRHDKIIRQQQTYATKRLTCKINRMEHNHSAVQMWSSVTILIYTSTYGSNLEPSRMSLESCP